MAVSKRQPAEAALAAVAAGAGDLGENYVQEAIAKQAEMAEAGSVKCRWHLIGHLQTNKARLAVDRFELIQSVDSARLARAIGAAADSAGKLQDVLVQVKLGHEDTKEGVDAASFEALISCILDTRCLRLQGLMGIAPAGANPQPYFRELRRQFEQLPGENRRTLSMGMSGDFAEAIREGSTMVRIGAAIFGERNSRHLS